ncbi:ABC transporter substrate-binding protein [Microbacterium sp. NIBRBAC000506063]|uniref:ABC transporter substrate-binding protein n=1 Tax=Microbacterium sp. NIBRBAC000506063 TaxID=2734618 RepID=UPI001BB63EA7|nr:ABC transporter substrate-binding protein [Microbacterium sp. NIBRBAC000506063]QTV79432.1 ABC transporter substrate-binding protein [Microbacterium sp. NIBRBAC000506063]
MQRPSRRLALIAALASTALALTACTGDQAEPGEPPSGEVDSNATLTVGLVLEPTNLDIRRTDGSALEQILIDNIYEGLVTRSGNEIVERLASSYEISEDALTYTFTLREGVTFHDGDELEASDVVASFEEVRSDEGLHSHSDFAGVESIEAPDEQTVVITLSEPNVNFLFALTGRAGLVFQEGDRTDLKTAENGTGPFTLSRWSQGSSITFQRYEDYWDGPAGVAEVVFDYITDATARINSALDGSVDVLVRVDPNLAPQLGDSGDFEIVQAGTTSTGTLAFNNARAPLTDERVREALRLAIDHDAIVEALGAGQTLFGPIPELDPGYEDLSEVAPHDPDRAAQLLADAGQENLELTLTIANHYSTTIPRLLVSDLAKVGVTLDVNVVEFATWLEDVYTNKDYDLSFVEHTEARDFVNFANPNYYFLYDNPEVQDLYAEALRQSDLDAAAALLARAARIVSEDHAADWLFTVTSVNAVRPGVIDFPDALTNARLDLRDVTVLAG